MPQTQTSCPNPASNSARAAVMRSLARGSDPAIAYIFNTGTQDNPAFAELKWYDVAKGTKTVITHLPNDNITGAQVSTDGQWILFVTNYPQYAALQLVRMDGQGLQTLYCTT
jgi:dipeptidyl aminopeptidase/acylaminoacyl peptidase